MDFIILYGIYLLFLGLLFIICKRYDIEELSTTIYILLILGFLFYAVEMYPTEYVGVLP